MRGDMNSHLPYLTADMAGVGGKIKVSPADFVVEELPLYEPCGEGEHVYLTFEKRDMATLQAINSVARALKINRKQIGYAGLKDAQAITRQTISIFGASPEDVTRLNIPGMTVLAVRRHRNKLKLGHLKGNRFVIRVKDVAPELMGQAESIMARLQADGVPNYYGRQRFGVRHNTHLLGLALIRGDAPGFMAELLGKPHPAENARVQEARAAFDAGDWAGALEKWPPILREEQRVLGRLARSGSLEAALGSLDKRLKRLFVAAFQSNLFNQLLTRRLDCIHRLEDGDVAWIHRNGACFVVESAEEEQPRADAFEISPAGPLFGSKYLPARGAPGQQEQAVLAEVGIEPAAMHVPGAKMDGGRRPYRIPLSEVDLRWDEGLVLRFSLPPGAYATVVLREVMKTDSAAL